MEGFFTKKETQSHSMIGGKLLSCVSCGLYKGVRSAKMKPRGNCKKGILIIGPSPSNRDDRNRSHWQGKEGRLLSKELYDLGVDLYEDCMSVYAINCTPPDERTPTDHEINCCRSVLVHQTIRKAQPLLIILLGTSAVKSFLGHRWPNDLGSIDKWRGWKIPDQTYGCWVVPTFSPSEVSEASKAEMMTVWRNDLKSALDLLKEPFLKHKEPEIEYLTDLSPLSKINTSSIAFDYETTGLKPHAKGHRIVSASVADTPDHVFSFTMPKTRKERKPFIDLLTNPYIGKRAHNMKYEDTWTKERLRVVVENWEWDSMIAAHILDNRSGITNLKFQAYVNFGIDEWSSEINPYLRSLDSKNGNAINRIDDLLKKPNGVKNLLKYGALDSIYEYRLSEKQIKEIDYDFLPF